MGTLVDRAGGFFLEHVGLFAVAGFALLVVVLLLWSFVIAPRRSQKIMKALEAYGYRPLDRNDPELATAIQALAPYSLEGPIKPELRDLARRVITAAVRTGTAKCFIANVSQMQETGIMMEESTRSGTMTIWQTLILEARALPFQTDLYISPRFPNSRVPPARHAKFGLQEVAAADADFARDFFACTRDGGHADIPQRLQRTLASLREYLLEPKGLKESLFRKDLLRFANMKFCSEGWGICVSGAWLDETTVKTVVKVADRISESL